MSRISKQETVCASCGIIVQSDIKYCGQCGCKTLKMPRCLCGRYYTFLLPYCTECGRKRCTIDELIFSKELTDEAEGMAK
jgi:hypothetical protein